jgi:signal transduction histidine kinase
MRREALDFISNLSTLGQILLGACLATAGGVAANQFEWQVQTRRRERTAALFFGEILSSVAIILKRADETKQIGEPFGPLTIRILRSARQEIEMYERNRENILDLRDAGLRARIYGLAHRLAGPLDGIIDATQEIAGLELQLRSRQLEAEDRGHMEKRIAALMERREATYDYIQIKSSEIQDVLTALSSLAGQTFALDEVAL